MRVRLENRVCNLPDFLIVGAARSGTTSLYENLRKHYQIFMPDNKEPWFFCFDDADKSRIDILKKKGTITDFSKYLALFEKASTSQAVGEASTTYLYFYESAIRNIKKYHPKWQELKIIIILRNPVERAFSHYMIDMATAGVVIQFSEVIKKWQPKERSEIYKYVDYGFYYNQVKAYKDNFSRVKIYLFEDLKNDAENLFIDLLNFLGVDTHFVLNTRFKYNFSGIPKNKFVGDLIYKPNIFKTIAKVILPDRVRLDIKKNLMKTSNEKPELKDFERNALKDIYKDDVVKLQTLIGRDLSDWIK